MLIKIHELIQKLNESPIRYCHWKSNFALAEALAGRTDVDLLVHRNDATLFRNLLARLSFRPASNADGKPFPSVEHHYALDEDKGILVHVHVYFRVITGGSLSKNYRLPVEAMLLQNAREIKASLDLFGEAAVMLQALDLEVLLNGIHHLATTGVLKGRTELTL